MPVVGHALIGVGLAAAVPPHQSQIDTHQPFGRWGLTLVVLSYLPDIAANTALLAGYRPPTALTHSLWFAIAAAAVMTLPVARLVRLTTRQAFAIILLCILLHDLTDILQSPGRMPLWPLRAPMNIGVWLPSSMLGEVLVLLPVALASVALWIGRRRRAGLSLHVQVVPAVTMIALMAFAAGVAELRHRRAQDVDAARALAEAGRYREALERCDDAERWPSPVRPGRVEYIRAVAWWGLGDMERAEAAYLRSHEADPTYIWTVADLAAFYASRDAPLEERQRRTEHWLKVLRSRFRNHPALPSLIARAERRLAH